MLDFGLACEVDSLANFHIHKTPTGIYMTIAFFCQNGNLDLWKVIVGFWLGHQSQEGEEDEGNVHIYLYLLLSGRFRIYLYTNKDTFIKNDWRKEEQEYQVCCKTGLHSM